MMDYQLFKNVVMERIVDSLPPLYSDYQPKISTVRKVNEEKEALTLVPPKTQSATAMPSIYMDDMYELFQQDEDLDSIMNHIIDIMLQFTGLKIPGLNDFDFNSKLDCLIMNLINTDLNRQFLESVPHTDVLDLSVIYRFIMCEEGNGFGTVVLNNDLMETLNISHEELHALAYANTLRMLPVEITEPFHNFYMMSNKRTVSGATTMICKECTDILAEKIQSDFYIIPGSIHEVYAVPAEDHDLKQLVCSLEEGNRLYVSKKEILSQSIYFYDYERKEIQIAGSYVTD